MGLAAETTAVGLSSFRLAPTLGFNIQGVPIDLKVTSIDGGTATIDLSLDQTRQLVIDLTNAYGACRPALLDQGAITSLRVRKRIDSHAVRVSPDGMLLVEREESGRCRIP